MLARMVKIIFPPNRHALCNCHSIPIPFSKRRIKGQSIKVDASGAVKRWLVAFRWSTLPCYMWQNTLPLWSSSPVF